MKLGTLTKVLILAAALGTFPSTGKSQGNSNKGPNGPGNSGNAPGHNKNAPFDLEWGLLLGSGIMYGLKRAYDLKKRKQAVI